MLEIVQLPLPVTAHDPWPVTVTVVVVETPELVTFAVTEKFASAGPEKSRAAKAPSVMENSLRLHVALKQATSFHLLIWEKLSEVRASIAIKHEA